MSMGEDIGRLAESVARLEEREGARVAFENEVREHNQRMETFIIGTPEVSGLRMDVDRLKVAEGERVWLRRLMIGAVVVSVLAAGGSVVAAVLG